MNKQQLAARIWASANKMRSKIEANEYKDYILGFIFYKFCSDREERHLREVNGWTTADLPQLDETDTLTVEDCRDHLGYFIAYRDLFSTWLNDPTFAAARVVDALNAFQRLIAPRHAALYAGIFNTLQAGLSKLGDTAGRQTKAINDLLALIRDIPTDDRQDYDVLGFIYEYLIGNFAANAGKKAGEFYTPHEVALMMSEIVAHHLRHRREITIYDPTSGSGSLLLNIGRSAAKYLPSRDDIYYYAQELKESTYNLTRMNLVMRGILPDNIHVRNADTLADDWPDDAQEPGHPLYCDAVVSNPPYSQEWAPGEEAQSDPRYRDFGVAPNNKADYAFLLHDLYHVRPDGIMTIVLPHGVLFRGGVEAEIRQRLVERNHIDTIIGLPANIFFGTGIPTLVMVLRQQRPERDDILFIDASQGFAKESNSNRLRARDIRRITDAVAERRDQEGFCRVVGRDEVRANAYNLNIPRYVSAAATVAPRDLRATLCGGVPQAEVEALTPFWQALPTLRDQLFRPAQTQGYLLPTTDDALAVITANADTAAYARAYADALATMPDTLHAALITALDTVRPADALEQAANDLFDRLRPFRLIDPYAAYQLLADQWRTIAADLETLQTEGRDAARATDAIVETKRRAGRDVEVETGREGRIIPAALANPDTLATLTDNDICRLLHQKWIAPLISALLDLRREQVEQKLAESVRALAERYAETLTDIRRDIDSAGAELASLIDQLSGTDDDMAALQALKELMR